MIRLYYHATPNSRKVALFLEEAGIPYEIVPVDVRKGEQHDAAFLAINPNAKLPAIVDSNGPAGATRVFDSSAILMYLAEKSGQFMGTPADRAELLSWLFFAGTGIGPYSGQSMIFQLLTPEKIPYAINRYRREAERHYRVLDAHLAGRDYIVGDSFSIVDISAWGWLDLAPLVLYGNTDPLAPYPHLKRWFQAIDARPAVARTRAVDASQSFKQEYDDEARRALFPCDFPEIADV
jgi:GST-like protein